MPPTSDSTQISLDDIRRSYTSEVAWGELQGDFPSYVLWRRLSFWVTLPLLRLGATANTVTLLHAALAMTLPIIAWCGGERAYLYVAAVAACAHVLDCVDGNLARVLESSSRLGGLLDAFVDHLFWALYLVSLGVLVERSSASWLAPRGVELALACAVLVLLNRFVRSEYALVFGQCPVFGQVRPDRLTLWARLQICVIGLERLYCLAIAVGGARGVLDVVLVAIAAYTALMFFGALVVTFGKAARGDDG